MVTMKQIREFGNGIAREFQAERVILFGSYASGEPAEDSDVDILVILPFKGKPVYQSVKMRMKLRPSFPVDIIVRTPENVRKRLEMGDDFMQQIMEEGKVLYEARHR